MRRVLKAISLALTLIVVTTPKLPAQERTPAGSFLTYRVKDVAGLTKQVASNTTVRNRYARHFAIAPDRVAESFTQGLRLVTLRNPLKTRMWYVNKQGKMASKTMVLPKGTIVFATKDGTPILASKCGNPLRASLPGPAIVRAPAKAGAAGAQVETASAAAATDKPVETRVLASETETVTAPITVPPAPEVMAAMPSSEPMVVAALPASPIAVAPSISGINLGWLAGLGGLAGLAVAETRSDTPDTPEPSSIIALGTGLLALPLSIKRFRRSQVRR